MPKQTKEKIEYRAGFDCKRNGANLINCNFRLFATPEQTKEWERGYKNAILKCPKSNTTNTL